MTQIRTIKGRAALDPRGKPYFTPTTMHGISLGYRKLEGRAGTWTARIADGQGGNRLQAIGTADDLQEKNGRDILDFAQAHAAAIKVTQVEPVEALTVAKALADYEAANKDRDPRNVSRVLHWLNEKAPSLLKTDVSKLTADALEAWRDAIEGKPATVNRTIRILKAALNLAVKRSRGAITNSTEWKIGLEPKAHKTEANNVILSDEQVGAIVRAAYEIDFAFGLYVEVGAVTGARPSQIDRLQVRDLIENGTSRLMMPTSQKGTGEKARNIAVPITASLAAKLKSNRGPMEPLLVRNAGDAWSSASADYARPFARAVAAAGLADYPQKVTYYALRHSSIVRRIALNVPLRIIASIHDTSTGMIEKHYSRDIDLHGDTGRVGVLEVPMTEQDNVVAFHR